MSLTALVTKYVIVFNYNSKILCTCVIVITHVNSLITAIQILTIIVYIVTRHSGEGDQDLLKINRNDKLMELLCMRFMFYIHKKMNKGTRI